MNIKEKCSKYLVYALCEPGDVCEVRYIGKTSTGMVRPRAHLKPKQNLGHTRKETWVRARLAAGLVPLVFILRECQSDAEAREWEVRLISMFRGLGFDLTNHTDGGGGIPGWRHSEDTKRVLSNKTLSYYAGLTPEQKQERIAAMLHSVETEEQKVARLAATRAFWASSRADACKQSRRNRRAGLKVSEEARANTRRAVRAIWASRTPEQRKAIGAKIQATIRANRGAKK